MKKTLKIVPVSLLAVCALVSCNNNSSSDASTSGGDTTSSTSTPEVKETLTDFVNKLAEGEQTKETIDALLADDELLASNDSLVTGSVVSLSDHWPASALKDEYKEDYTHDLEEDMAFYRYDNKVVATGVECSYKGYDADTEDNFSEATEYTGVGYLYEDSDGKTRYTYTQNEDAENVYSFSYAKKISDEDKAKFYNAGGISDFVSTYSASAEENFAYYEDAYASYNIAVFESDYSAVKEGNKLTVTSNNSFTFYFSLETNYGYQGGKKVYDYWDNFYVTNSYLYNYSFTIEDGIITKGQVVDGGFNTLYVEDTAKALTPTTTGALSVDDVEKMTLVIPEKIVSPSTLQEVTNPRNNPNTIYVLDDEIYTIVSVQSTKRALGDFDTTKLPDPTSYRSDIEGDDIGAWIDVQDLVECEEAE